MGNKLQNFIELLRINEKKHPRVQNVIYCKPVDSHTWYGALYNIIIIISPIRFNVERSFLYYVECGNNPIV